MGNVLLNRRLLYRFALAGSAGAVVETLVLFMVVQFGGLPAISGAVVGKEAGILFVFILNDEWTFSEAAGTDAPLWRRLVGSHLIRVLGVVVGLVVLKFFVTYTQVWYLFANFVGIVAGGVLNYVLESLVTWKTHKKDGDKS